MGNNRSNFLSHALAYLLARGLPGIITFLTIPLFTHYMQSPADYGRYALVIATVNVLNALLFQWLRLSLVRYAAVYRDDPAKLKGTLMSVTILLNAVIGLGALVIAAIPAFASIRPMLLPIWLVLVVQSMYELCCEYSRAIIRPWHYMVLQLLRSCAFVGLGLGLIVLGWAWKGPIAGLIVGMGAAVVFSMLVNWRDLRPVVDGAVFKQLAVYGIPLSLTVGLAVVIFSSDRFLLAYFLGEQFAGLYSVAVDLTSQTLTLLMMVIQMAIYPLAIRAYETHGKEAAQEQMKSNAAMLMAVGVPCVVGMAVLVEGIVENLLGPGFRPAAVEIIPLVALGAFLAGMKAYHFDAAFQFAHRTIYQVWIVLAVAIVNVILNLLMIPLWGMDGSAIASVLAYILSIGLTIYFGRRHFVLPFPRAAALQVLLAAGVMAAVLWPFRHNTHTLPFILHVMLGGTIYGAVLTSLNFLNLRDALLSRLGSRTRVPSLPAAHCPLPTGAE
jgi:O-antigen/teichoic acid export membrane protein